MVTGGSELSGPTRLFRRCWESSSSVTGSIQQYGCCWAHTELVHCYHGTADGQQAYGGPLYFFSFKLNNYKDIILIHTRIRISLTVPLRFQDR
jgi:hypothetical protein